MFCKNCFKKISNRSCFCKYCGAPIKQKKKLKDEKESDEQPVQGPPPPPPEKKEHSFKLRSEKDKEFPIPPKYIGIVIGAVLVVALVSVLIKSSVFQGTNSLNYNDYVGVWQERGTDDVETAGGVRLEVLSVDGNTITISLGIYDGRAVSSGISVKNIGATIKDGEAYYTFSDDGSGNSGKGSLTFKGRDIEWKSVVNNEIASNYEVVKVKNSITDEETLASDATTAAEETTETKPKDDYILPDSATRYMKDQDVEGLTIEQLRIARNEIMARHGRKFNDKELQAYFESKGWYKGTIDPEAFDSQTVKELNEYEIKNIAFIKSKE